MRTIRSADYRWMKWKNGGGETAEIAISPPGSSLETFDWRISMARVAVPGPFSIFPGIDRTLAVIGGAGVALNISGEQNITLDRNSEPFVFSGELVIHGTPVGGAIDDLNAMSRIGRCRHRLSRDRIGSLLTLEKRCETLILMLNCGDIDVDANGGRATLAAGDTLVIDETDRAEFTVTPAAEAELILIEIWRC